MKKIGVFIIILLLFSCAVISAQGSTSENINKYTETAGIYLLKFQNLFMGLLSFVSFGAFKQGGTAAFSQFLFMIMIFMVFYSIIDFFTDKFIFLTSLILTIISFLAVSPEQIEFLLHGYESLGITVTVILPVLILLTFTFRMYQKAYEGKSEKSPFYIEMFNLVFLVFFGIFFIRYSKSEDGAMEVLRFGSGWVLIGLGIMQTFLYKILAKIFHNWKPGQGDKNEEEAIVLSRRKAAEEIKDLEAEQILGNKGPEEERK